MPSVEYLREFVKERLTAAAEEIFGVFQRTIIEYEEELERQRQLLHVGIHETGTFSDFIGRQNTELHRCGEMLQPIGSMFCLLSCCFIQGHVSHV